MERRFNHKAGRAKVELREGTGVAPMISGHAAVYYDGTPETEYQLWQDMYERILPGAFDRAIKEGDDARALFNHDPSLILGRVSAGTCRLEADKTGLRYEVDLGDTTVAKDVRAHILRGDVTGSSFGFAVKGQNFRLEDRDGREVEIREIVDVELFDVSPVTYPAYEGTDAAARSAGNLDEAKAAVEAARAKRRENGRRKMAAAARTKV